MLLHFLRFHPHACPLPHSPLIPVFSSFRAPILSEHPHSGFTFAKKVSLHRHTPTSDLEHCIPCILPSVGLCLSFFSLESSCIWLVASYFFKQIANTLWKRTIFYISFWKVEKSCCMGWIFQFSRYLPVWRMKRKLHVPGNLSVPGKLSWLVTLSPKHKLKIQKKLCLVVETLTNCKGFFNGETEGGYQIY